MMGVFRGRGYPPAPRPIALAGVGILLKKARHVLEGTSGELFVAGYTSVQTGGEW